MQEHFYETQIALDNIINCIIMRTEQNKKNKIIIFRDEQETIRYDHPLPLGFGSIYAEHNPTKLKASCFKNEVNRNKMEFKKYTLIYVSK